MKIYNYDENGVFTHESEASRDPMEPEKFLLPRLATFDPIPEYGAFERPVLKNGKWKVVKDYRGKNFFDADGKEYFMADMGDYPEWAIKYGPDKSLKRPKFVNDEWVETAILYDGVVVDSEEQIEEIKRKELLDSGALDAMIDFLVVGKDSKKWQEFLSKHEQVKSNAEKVKVDIAAAYEKKKGDVKNA